MPPFATDGNGSNPDTRRRSPQYRTIIAIVGCVKSGWCAAYCNEVSPVAHDRSLEDSAAALELERRLAQVFRNVESWAMCNTLLLLQQNLVATIAPGDRKDNGHV